VGAADDVVADKRAQPAPRASRFVPELARDLDELCARLLDRDPAKRPSAADVAAQFGTPNHAPRAAASATRPPPEASLLGRAAALADVVAGLDATAPTATVVSGPLGVGKSALLEQVEREAALRGALVVRGHSLVDGLARAIATLPAAMRAALLPADAGAINYLCPSFARVLPVRPSWDPPATLIARGRAALATLVERLGHAHRVVAIVDDASDEDLALLAALPPTITVVVAVDELGRVPFAARAVALAPLAEPDAIALAERFLGAGVPGAAALARRSGGHPLVLAQLARAPHAEASELVELVAARYRALSERARTIVRVVAAAAGPLRQDVLGSALGLTHRTVTRELEQLVDGLWLRTTGHRRNDLVELHHRAVAEAIARDLPLTDEHALLAAALDNSGLGDDATRLHHWTRGGDRGRAGALAIALVERARDRHELVGAAAACAALLAIAPAPPLRAALLRARADARLGAGELADAADDYLAAADAFDLTGCPDHALDARRLAAEHLIRNGQIERGVTVTYAVAQAAGMALAMSSGRQIGALLIERARSRLRGSALPDALDDAAGRLADVCLSLGAALSMIDLMRAAWFTSRGVRAALDSGEPRRVARGLAQDSCVQVAGGGPAVGRALRALALADRLLDGEGRPPDRAIRALITAARGATGFLVGDFAGAVALGDEASARFRTGSPRAAYQARAATLFVVTATAWRGRWADAAARRATLEREAAASGDRYGVVFALTGYGVIAELAAGVAPGELRDRIGFATQGWPRDLAPAIAAREIIALAVCDLYQGRPDAARLRLATAGVSLDDAYLGHVDHLRAAFLELSARAAIRCDELVEAGAAAQALSQIGWAAGPALLLQATIAARLDQPARARALLEQGAGACEAAGLEAHATAARDRLAQLDRDPVARAAAEAQRVALGLGDPARAFGFLLPWR